MRAANLKDLKELSILKYASRIGASLVEDYAMPRSGKQSFLKCPHCTGLRLRVSLLHMIIQQCVVRVCVCVCVF